MDFIKGWASVLCNILVPVGINALVFLFILLVYIFLKWVF